MLYVCAVIAFHFVCHIQIQSKQNLKLKKLITLNEISNCKIQRWQRAVG